MKQRTSLPSEEETTQKLPRTLACKSRPDSGLDSVICHIRSAAARGCPLEALVAASDWDLRDATDTFHTAGYEGKMWPDLSVFPLIYPQDLAYVATVLSTIQSTEYSPRVHSKKNLVRCVGNEPSSGLESRMVETTSPQEGGGQIICFNHLGVYQKTPDSGRRQYKSRN